MACEPLYYTLQIHPDLTQDIPVLTIRNFPADFEPPTPSVVGEVRATAYTPAQKPLLVGALAARLEWAIACKLTEDEYLQLKALYRWQQNRMLADQDARLQWIDRFEPTAPEDSGSLTRDITDAKTTGYGLTYGYPVVSCTITRPTGQLTGNRQGAQMRLCTFVVGEHR